MTEETAAPEAGGAETVAPVEPTTTPEAPAKPEYAQSSREAVARALDMLDKRDAEPEAQEPQTERQRDERGRFAPTTAEAADEAEEAVEAPKVETVAKPPRGLSKDAAEAWAQAPEAVRKDVERRFAEMERGIAQYQQEYGPLKEYADMARQHGTTLKQALDNYVGIERLLASDPKTAFERLARNAGVDLASMFGGQPEGQQAQQDAQTITALRQELAELRRGLQGFQQTYQQTEQQRAEQAAMQTVQAFAQAHPRLDELSADIAHMLQTGFATSLEDAYEKADRLNPAPQLPPAPQPNPQQAAQTRARASLTTNGAPGPGSDPRSRTIPPTANAAVRNAFDRLGF